MTWFEIKHESKHKRAFVQHKGKKPANTPSLQVTKGGTFKVLPSASPQGKQRATHRDAEPSKFKYGQPTEFFGKQERTTRHWSGEEREPRRWGSAASEGYVLYKTRESRMGDPEKEMR